MGDQADALRQALIKLDEIEQLIWDHIDDTRLFDALNTLKYRLTHDLQNAESQLPGVAWLPPK